MSSSSAPASVAWPWPRVWPPPAGASWCCERRDVTGGKLARLRRDGFSVDVGPSLLTLPDVFEEVFRMAGTSLSEHVELVRLDPQFHYHWSDGSSLVVPDGTERPPRRSKGWRPVRASSGDGSTSVPGGSGRSPPERSSPGRWEGRGSWHVACGRRPISWRSSRTAPCTAWPRRTSRTPASSSGPVGTPRTRGRRRIALLRRWRASHTSSRITAAGTCEGASTSCARRSSR